MKFIPFLKKNKNWVMAALIAALILALSSNSYFVYIMINATINAIAVVGIVIITGYARQLHLGQYSFLGIGAYTTAILMTKWGFSFWATIPFAIIFSGLMGWLLSIPTLKLKGNAYLALVTQIFGEIIYILLLNLEGLTNGAFGIRGIAYPKIGSFVISDLSHYMFLCIGILIIITFFVLRIVKSKYGRYFQSIRDSEDAAQSVGINTRRCKMIAFTLATSVAGVAGVLYASYIGYLSPEQFRWAQSLELVSMAIVGGMGSVQGGILGALILTFLPELLRSAEELRMIIYGLTVMLTLAFLPDGVISLVGKSWPQIKEMFRLRVVELSGFSIRKKGYKKRAHVKSGS